MQIRIRRFLALLGIVAVLGAVAVVILWPGWKKHLTGFSNREILGALQAVMGEHVEIDKELDFERGQLFYEGTGLLEVQREDVTVGITGQALLACRRGGLAMASFQGTLTVTSAAGNSLVLQAGQRLRTSRGAIGAPQPLPAGSTVSLVTSPIAPRSSSRAAAITRRT